jgi:hypothetical protein
VAVKVTVTERLSAGSLPPYTTLVIDPFQIEIEPGTWAELGLAKAIEPSTGIAPATPATQGTTSVQGLAVVSVRLYEVR